MIKAVIYCILFSLIHMGVFGQNITGSWEGIMSGELLKINIVQEGDLLCGYTSDVVILNKRSFCKAYFKGKYNQSTGVWTISGTRFIENSGDHILMTIRLWEMNGQNKQVLKGSVSASNYAFDVGEYFTVKKINNVPQKISKRTPVCYEPLTPPIKKNAPPPAAIQLEKKKNIPTASKKNTELNINTETFKKKDSITIEPKFTEIEASPEEIEMKKRDKGTFATLKIKSKKIEIKVYDNGEVDNDTISIYYNNHLIIKDKKISQDPLVVNLELDEKESQHELTLFAVNLGRIPPNTALMVITDGTRKMELHASANLAKNATVNLLYEP